MCDRRHLVARLATIKNALVRCAKRAAAVFTGAKCPSTRNGERKRDRNEGEINRKREEGERERQDQEGGSVGREEGGEDII